MVVTVETGSDKRRLSTGSVGLLLLVAKLLRRVLGRCFGMGQGPDFERNGIGAAVVPQIRVDLASFATLRDTMTTERDLTLRPNVSTTLDDYCQDPGLAAASPSMNMAAFRGQYGPCLQDVVDRL